MKKYFIGFICSVLLLTSCGSDSNKDELKLVTEYLSDHGLHSNNVFNLVQNMQNSENFPFNEKTSSWNYLVDFVKNENESINTDGYNIEINDSSFNIIYEPTFVMQEQSKASPNHLAISSQILTSDFKDQLTFLNDFERNNGYFTTDENIGKSMLKTKINEKFDNDWTLLIQYIVYSENNKEDQLNYHILFSKEKPPIIISN